MSQFEAGNSLNRIEMSQNLRGSLQRAISYAYEQSHQQVTLEHLLLALVDDREATVILEASAVNVPSLLTEVSDYLGRLEDRAADKQRRQPALGGDIQHIIQSAGAAAQKSKRNAVSSALVLAAIVGDGRSPSAQMLRNHGMTFESAITALKQANASEPTRPTIAVEAPGRAPVPAQSAAVAQSASVATSPQPNAPPQQLDVAAASASTGADGVRLQNMQAAHEIIANARERIAAARGTVAVHAKEAKPRVPQPAPSITEPNVAASIRRPAPAEVTAPPAAHAQAPVTPSSAVQRSLAPQPVAMPRPAATPQRANDLSQPSRGVPQPIPQKPVSQQPVSQQPVPQPAAQGRPSTQSPTAPQQPVPAMPPQAGAGPMALPTPPQPDRAPPAQQPPVYRQPAAERPQSSAYGLPNGSQTVPPGGGPRTDGRQVRATVADGFEYPPAPEYTAPQPRSSELTPIVRPIEPEKLAEFVPSKMCVGVPTTIEIRAPRARLEAWSGGNADPHERDGQIITKAMVMRLKAPDGGFTVEIASPETQWSEGSMGPLSDDVVSWRWIVTPMRRGRRTLQLKVSTRVVGRDGLAAARSLPEQVVNVRVAPNYGRLTGRLAIWIFLALSGTALGYFGDRLFSMGSSMLAQVIQ